MVTPVVYLSRLKAGLHVVSFEIASRDAQTLNLSRNMSKFYAWQVGSWMNEHQSQNLLLKVDPLSTIRNNKLNTRGEKLETSATLRVLYRCLQLKRRYTKYGFCFSYFASFWAQCKILILFCSTFVEDGMCLKKILISRQRTNLLFSSVINLDVGRLRLIYFRIASISKILTCSTSISNARWRTYCLPATFWSHQMSEMYVRYASRSDSSVLRK